MNHQCYPLRNIHLVGALLLGVLAMNAIAFDALQGFVLRPEVALSVGSTNGADEMISGLNQYYANQGEYTVPGSSSTSSRLLGLGSSLISPEWHRLSGSVGAHLSYSSFSISNSYYMIPIGQPFTPENTTTYNAEYHSSGVNLDVEFGFQARPFNRHIFALRDRYTGLFLVAPHTNPRNSVAISYAYRLFDRIELGFELDLNDPDYNDGKAITTSTYQFTPTKKGAGREKRLRIAWPFELGQF